MTKERLFYEITGTENPNRLTDREILIIDKCLTFINDNTRLNKEDMDFITDSALNGLWYQCHENLQKKDLGDIERKNMEWARDKAKEIMKKIDPTLF